MAFTSMTPSNVSTPDLVCGPLGVPGRWECSMEHNSHLPCGGFGAFLDYLYMVVALEVAYER